MDQSYDFPVELKPLYTVSGKSQILVPKKLAVVRTDTDASLGIVSDKYAFLKHETVVDGFREALKGHKFTEKISLSRGGAQLWAEFTLKDIQADVKKGDTVGMQILARNSYDGSTQLLMSLGTLRLVCKNGMTTGRSFIEFSYKHIGSDLKLDVGEVRRSIETLAEHFKSVIPNMQRLSKAKVTLSDDQLFDPKNVKLPSYILEKARDRFAVDTEAGEGLWKVYNAYTWAITHQMRKEAPALQAHYGQVAWSSVMRELETA